MQDVKMSTLWSIPLQFSLGVKLCKRPKVNTEPSYLWYGISRGGSVMFKCKSAGGYLWKWKVPKFNFQLLKENIVGTIIGTIIATIIGTLHISK